MHTNSKDEALSLPTEDSAKLALRTQQILAYESGIANVVDPLAGSYYVESLTDSIEHKAVELIKKIDDLGGAISAIENNFQQNEISNTAFEYQKAIENKKQIIIGLNKYEERENNTVPLQNIDHNAIDDQLNRLKKFKSNRNPNNVVASIKKLEMSLTNNKNLLPIIIECIKNHCTLGEICQTMREVHGEYL